MVPVVAEKREEIAKPRRRYGVRRLDLFGSAARAAAFTDKSDVDLLVECKPGRSPSWAHFLAFLDDLATLFGRSVDFVMANAV